MKTILLAAAAALLVTSPALSQPAPAASAKARAVVELLGTEQILDTMFRDLSPLVGAQIVSVLENTPATRLYAEGLIGRLAGGRERLVAIFAEEFLAEIRLAYPDVKAETARLYQSHFSETELDQLHRFYSTGAGAKFLRLQPEFQEQMRLFGQGKGRLAGEKVGPRGLERAEVEARGK
jgi:hypothetical protein